MEIPVKAPARLMLVAALAITTTVSMLSSPAAARMKGYQLPPPQAMPHKPIPLPPDCPRCGGRIKLGQDTISPLRAWQGMLGPTPNPWVPIRRLSWQSKLDPTPEPWRPAGQYFGSRAQPEPT